MSDSVWPHRRQPTRLPHPWGSPGKNTGVGCHVLLQFMKVKSESEATQSRLTLSDPMDYSLPGSSIHGIFQARVLEWGAITFSNGGMTISYKWIFHYTRLGTLNSCIIQGSTVYTWTDVISRIYFKIIKKVVEYGVLSLFLFHHQLLSETFEFIILTFVFFVYLRFSVIQNSLKGETTLSNNLWFNVCHGS